MVLQRLEGCSDREAVDPVLLVGSDNAMRALAFAATHAAELLKTEHQHKL